MQPEPGSDSASRSAVFGLMRGVAAVVMALAFMVWALVSAAKVPCVCDGSLTVRGAAMPWLSTAVLLVAAATVLLLRVEGSTVVAKGATLAGSVGLIAAYGAFVGRSLGYAGQTVLAGISGLVFTAGVSGMIWKGASKKMGAAFGVAVGSSVVVVTFVILLPP